jgi:hypothetical protein
VNHTTTIDLLLELIAGLDRRVPQMERAGEVAIAEEAAALKAAALARIAELQSELPNVARAIALALIVPVGAHFL